MYKKKIIDGYFERTMEYDKRLEYMPNASAGVMIRDVMNGYIAFTLVSYSTGILELIGKRNNDGFEPMYLIVGDVSYSRTTMRHVSAFLKEYLPSYSYHELRDIFKSDFTTKAINVNTGRVINRYLDVYEYLSKN